MRGTSATPTPSPSRHIMALAAVALSALLHSAAAQLPVAQSADWLMATAPKVRAGCIAWPCWPAGLLAC
jgi:hypothetical protein